MKKKSLFDGKKVEEEIKKAKEEYEKKLNEIKEEEKKEEG